LSKIPSETLDAISSRIDAVEVVGRYVQLKRSGQRYLGLCPFHGERTPSFTVDKEKALWYCYGCSEGGSVYNFLMRIEGLTFPQAVKKLGDEVGIEVVAERSDPVSQRRDALRDLLERTAQYYSEMLHRSPLGEPARAYLRARGITAETAQKFRLGWALPSGDALLKKLQQAGYQPSDGVEAGVLRERNGRFSDLLRGRLTFPICSGQGKVIAFGGRLIESSPDSKAPKYLNTPETELYQKREHLYGLSVHRGEISRANEALVMEGYLDVIAVSQAGFPLAVASLGTALTEEQCRLLARYARKVHLFYDADRAGRSATEKAIELFENTGLLVHIGQMEQGQDPDSLIKEQGAEAFARVKERTVSVVDYLIDLKSREFDITTVAGKEDFLRAVLPALARIKDQAQRDHYAQTLRTITFVPENVLLGRVQALARGGAGTRPSGDSGRRTERAVVGQGSSTPTNGPAVAAARRASGSRSSLHAEERLLSVLLRRSQWIPFVKERLTPEELSRPELRPFLEVLLRLRSIERPLTWTDLGDHDPDREAVWARLSANDPPESTDEDMEKLIRDIKQRGLAPRFEAIRRQVLEGLSNGDVGPESPLYKEYLDLQQRLKGTKNE
jgi:DNA primase